MSIFAHSSDGSIVPVLATLGLTLSGWAARRWGSGASDAVDRIDDEYSAYDRSEPTFDTRHAPAADLGDTDGSPSSASTGNG